eukprot:3185073-Lingulodinium_polyedra.AAC.1
MQAVSRWSGIRPGGVLENGPDEMSNRQLGILLGTMRSWQLRNLIREVPEQESRTLSVCDTEEE